jgi:hypothetical protein
VDESVSFELLVEGEHGSLGGWVHVTGTTTAAKEDLGSGRWNGDWDCSLTRGDLSCGELAVIASTTTATVVDGASEEGGLLGNLDRHVY